MVVVAVEVGRATVVGKRRLKRPAHPHTPNQEGHNKKVGRAPATRNNKTPKLALFCMEYIQ